MCETSCTGKSCLFKRLAKSLLFFCTKEHKNVAVMRVEDIDHRKEANKNPFRKMPVESVPGSTEIYNEWMIGSDDSNGMMRQK